VLLRDGAHKVSVMSVSREADVAKTLIYKYFDGLVGLIKTWLDRRQQWPDLRDLYAEEPTAGYADNPLLYQKQGLLQLAKYLRGHPLALELMMAELLESGPVTTALRELRLERVQEDSRFLGHDLPSSAVEGKQYLRIFYAAISYLVLRARSSPEYMGTVRLDTDAGWDEIMSDFEDILDDLIAFQAQIDISKKRLKGRQRKH
jgi:AcrR family transcriptional regulator